MKPLNHSTAVIICIATFVATGVRSSFASPTTSPAESTVTPKAGVLRVAIFQDTGAGEDGGENVEKCLKKVHPEQYTFKKIKGEDVRNGALDHFDVAVFPGGSGSAQAKSLDTAGREKVKEFVKNGGGYLGICGGAYLATTSYKWSLDILNAKVIDRAHWNRGDPTPVKLELNSTGQQALGEPAEVTCIYHQGPLLAPSTQPDLPAYEPLATFGSEVTQRGPSGVMIGTTAMARAMYGKGHVFLISPHPERSDGLDGVIRAAIAWIAPHAEPTTQPLSDAR